MTGSKWLGEIRKADKAGLVAKTRELCEGYLRDFPDHGAVWLRLGSKLIGLHLYAEAEAALARAAELAESKVQLAHTHAMRGHLELERGDLPGAEQWYWKAHLTCPEKASFLTYCGEIASALGDLERALQLLERASECTKADVDEAHYYRAGVLLAMRRYGEAAEAYHAALAIDPLNEDYLKGLAEVESLLG